MILNTFNKSTIFEEMYIEKKTEYIVIYNKKLIN